MTRRGWCLLPLAAAACRNRSRPAIVVFPESVDGGWRRVELRAVPVSEAPDPVPRNSIEQIRAASYKGEGDSEIQARVYLLNSADVGAALGTRWRPSADTVFFDHDKYFVVVKYQGAKVVAVQEFVADLQKRLGAAAKPKGA